MSTYIQSQFTIFPQHYFPATIFTPLGKFSILHTSPPTDALLTHSRWHLYWIFLSVCPSSPNGGKRGKRTGLKRGEKRQGGGIHRIPLCGGGSRANFNHPQGPVSFFPPLGRTSRRGGKPTTSTPRQTHRRTIVNPSNRIYRRTKNPKDHTHTLERIIARTRKHLTISPAIVCSRGDFSGWIACKSEWQKIILQCMCVSPAIINSISRWIRLDLRFSNSVCVRVWRCAYVCILGILNVHSVACGLNTDGWEILHNLVRIQESDLHFNIVIIL